MLQEVLAGLAGPLLLLGYYSGRRAGRVALRLEATRYLPPVDDLLGAARVLAGDAVSIGVMLKRHASAAEHDAIFPIGPGEVRELARHYLELREERATVEATCLRKESGAA